MHGWSYRLFQVENRIASEHDIRQHYHPQDANLSQKDRIELPRLSKGDPGPPFKKLPSQGPPLNS